MKKIAALLTIFIPSLLHARCCRGNSGWSSFAGGFFGSAVGNAITAPRTSSREIVYVQQPAQSVQQAPTESRSSRLEDKIDRLEDLMKEVKAQNKELKEENEKLREKLKKKSKAVDNKC